LNTRRIKQLVVRIVAGTAVVAGLVLAAGNANALPYADQIVQTAAAGVDTGNGAK
jgi:hypothetical protein